MPTKHEMLALRHAPVLHQKINDLNPRGDYITRVNLSGSWDDIVGNWEHVQQTGNPLEAAGYYSVAETVTLGVLLSVSAGATRFTCGSSSSWLPKSTFSTI